MAEFRVNPTVAVNYTMIMSEAELRALKLAADFGATDAICAMSSEFNAHRKTLADFFSSVRNDGSVQMKRIEHARRVALGNMVAIEPKEGEQR